MGLSSPEITARLAHLAKTDPAKYRELLALTDRLERRLKAKIFGRFPETGPLRRELYPRHLEWFAAGREHRERLFLCANRVGKTDAGAFEMALHLTGRYDEYAPWWQGRRFDTPIQAWAAGDTTITVRDIVQVALLGPAGRHGTGMIPEHDLVSMTGRTGVPGAVETIRVHHISGGQSELQLRSYDQRREAFQGTSKHVIWLDEECPDDIYAECLLRTMDTPDLPGGGLLMLTFTPLLGLTPMVLSFLPGGSVNGPREGNKAVVQATWDDAPHLDPKAREELWASIPVYQRDARSKGIPQLGSGAIYQVPESEMTVDPFELPKHWPRCWGLDTGWDVTAAVWLAWDRETDTAYAYQEYRRSQAEIPIHVDAVKSKGAWIPGCGDAAQIINTDGRQVIDLFRAAGLDIMLPDKAVEAGIQTVWERLSAGKLKVFASCRGLLEEYRLYRRDEKGKVVKQNDHLMDALRYAVRSGLPRARVQPVEPDPGIRYRDRSVSGQSWMG